MKKLLVCLLLVTSSLFILAQVPGNDLLSLAQIRNGIKSKRISSYDTTGNNDDKLNNIKTGEKRVLFNVKGSGIINHIWITIAPGPEAVKRDDIVIRMYWDNNEYPSVESPLGIIFRTGME